MVRVILPFGIMSGAHDQSSGKGISSGGWQHVVAIRAFSGHKSFGFGLLFKDV